MKATFKISRMLSMIASSNIIEYNYKLDISVSKMNYYFGFLYKTF